MLDKNYGGAAILDNFGCDDERVKMALSSYMDGEADAVERAMVEWHLQECRPCQLLLAGWGQQTGILRQATHTLDFDIISRAIADQTRSWLVANLEPQPPTVAPRREKVHRAPRLALGLIGAMTSMVFALGLTFSLLLGNPDLKSAAPTAPAIPLNATVSAVTAMPNVPLVTRSSLSTTGTQPATYFIATPSYPVYIYNVTPGVNKSSGRD